MPLYMCTISHRYINATYTPDIGDLHLLLMSASIIFTQFPLYTYKILIVCSLHDNYTVIYYFLVSLVCHK